MSDDAPEPAGPPAAAVAHVDAHVGAGPSPDTSDLSDDTSTLSSVSTSTLSPTSLSCDSSDDDPVAWPEADREFLQDVPSESDDWELAAEEDDETGEREVARRIPK